MKKRDSAFNFTSKKLAAMSLTKTQKGLLKKIDSSFIRMIKLSEKTGMPLNELEYKPRFQFPEEDEIIKKKNNEGAHNRRIIFEQTNKRNSKA